MLGIALGVVAAGGSNRVLVVTGIAAAITESISIGAVAHTSFGSERDLQLAWVLLHSDSRLAAYFSQPVVNATHNIGLGRLSKRSNHNGRQILKQTCFSRGWDRRPRSRSESGIPARRRERRRRISEARKVRRVERIGGQRASLLTGHNIDVTDDAAVMKMVEAIVASPTARCARQHGRRVQGRHDQSLPRLVSRSPAPPHVPTRNLSGGSDQASDSRIFESCSQKLSMLRPKRRSMFLPLPRPTLLRKRRQSR
jgi:hypothetical protein